jgi:hypothetical protein
MTTMNRLSLLFTLLFPALALTAQSVTVRITPVEMLGANTEHEGIVDTQINSDSNPFASPDSAELEPVTTASIPKSVFQAALSAAYASGIGGVADMEAANLEAIGGSDPLDISELVIALPVGDISIVPGPGNYVEGGCSDGYKGRECFGTTSYLDPSPPVSDVRNWNIGSSSNAPSGAQVLSNTTSYDFMFNPADRLVKFGISYRIYVNFQSHRATKPFPEKPNVRVRATFTNGSDEMQVVTTGFTYDGTGENGNNTFFGIEQPADGYYLSRVELWSIGNNARVWAALDDLAVIADLNPPEVLSQPVGVGVTAGNPFSLSVEASGSDPLSYQWRKDGVAIEGATSATYSVASAQLSDTGPYDCVVSNGAGEVISNVAVVSVTAAAQPPEVTQDPPDTTVNEGAALSLSATVTGTGPLSYQWRKDGADIEGATGASLEIGEVQLSDAGSYTVFITNAQGSTESGAAVLTVNAVIAPVITQAPAGVEVTEGEVVSLSVSASGTEPFSYQWRRNGLAIAGATGATLEISESDPADSGSYDVVVSNYKGSVTSAAATVTVNPIIIAPAITMAPKSVAVTEGDPVSLSVSASGTAPFTYQWRKDGVDIAGAVSATLSINAAGLSSAGDYDVVVTNASGSATSAAATVTVYPLPTVDPLLIQVDGRVQEVQITVTAVPQVSWTATEDADWLRIPSGFAGKGDGMVRLVILANETGEARSATVQIGGREVTVLQGFLPQAEGFDAVVGSGTGDAGKFVSPWFGAYTYGTPDWIKHSELGWLYVGFAEDPANMFLFSLTLNSWVWTNEQYFSVLYDFSRAGYVFYFIVEGSGTYLFDYTTGSWSQL